MIKEELPLRLIYLSLLTILYSQDSLDVELDLDRLWEEAVWEEIEDVVDVYYEVEQITPVAGVRGAEAEDEALKLLYYRRSMKGLSELQLRKALGKLINKRSKLVKEGKVVPEEIDKYIVQLKTRLKIS